MTNMDYCRFRNTYNDLLDCVDHIDEVADEYEPMDKEEHEARLSLIQACADIFDQLGVTYNEEELSDKMKELNADFENEVEQNE